MLKRIALLLLITSAWGQPAPKPARNYKQPTSIKIGTLTYEGGYSNGSIDQSFFDVKMDTAGVTTAPITFGDLEMFVFNCPNTDGPCTAASQDLRGQGPFTTPGDILWEGGIDSDGQIHTLPNCNDFPCVCVEVQIISATGNPFPVTLVTGQTITVPAVITVALEPLPGQLFIQPGQSVDISLALPAPQ